MSEENKVRVDCVHYDGRDYIEVESLFRAMILQADVLPLIEAQAVRKLALKIAAISKTQPPKEREE